MNTVHGRLNSLPVELLYEIFIFSGSYALPLTSKHIHSVFKYAPSSVQAEYIVTRYLDELAQNPRVGLVTKALRRPICTEAVLEAILRLPDCPKDVERDRVELPRRLFRSLAAPSVTPWTREDRPLPFLRYLYDHPRIPRPYSNSWEGYPLTKAVASRHIPLVQFLLEQGASPALKNALAVHVAIRLKDLPLVRRLIEQRDSADSTPGVETTQQTRVEIWRQRRFEDDLGEKKSTKKRKLADRVEVSQDMLQTAVACNARDIVEYFVQEKSCMPDMQTVKLIGTAHSTTGSTSGWKKRKARR